MIKIVINNTTGGGWGNAAYASLRDVLRVKRCPRVEKQAFAESRETETKDENVRNRGLLKSEPALGGVSDQTP